VNEASSDLDLVILGSGPGGYVAALRASQLGLSVAVVEKDARPGGTCLHRGCIPTKAWLRTAELLDDLAHAGDFGVVLEGGARFDGAGARAYRHKVVDKNARGVEFLLKRGGVRWVRGRGRLAGPGRVEVAGDEGATTLASRFVVLATGSVPQLLPLAPTDGVRVVDSDQILETETVPSSLIVLGGGAVGCEFASIFASLGSRVTLVEMLPALLPLEDAEVSAELERSFRRRGIDVRTATRLTRVESGPQGVVATLEGEAAGARVEAAQLLVAVGRKPVLEDLGLEAAGVRVEDRCVAVDRWMRTSADGVYAIGDVVKTPWLAHVAMAEGILAVEHMAGVAREPIDYDRVPSATYCDPEVASVGLTEERARERGYQVATGRFPFSASGKAAILGRTAGFVKVVRETRYDEVLGVHVIGPHATDLIAEACVALRMEATTEELMRTMHAHPTLSEAVVEAAHAALGGALHA
jgi:dihydrolipoamide dehydrogenase